MTAVQPGLAAADLEARCCCRCPRSEHRLLRPGVYGGCRAHSKCGTFELDESVELVRPAIDPGVVCGCGASRGQHYPDDGRMRGPRGCQDFHLKCTPLCKHALPTLRRHAHGEPVAPAIADRSLEYQHHGYNHLTLKPASEFEEPLDDLEAPDAVEPASAVESAASAPAGSGDDDDAAGRPVEADAPAAPVVPRRPRRTPARPAAPSALGPAVVVGESDAVEEVAAADSHGPVAATAPHTPGAGWARAKAELGDMVPDLTEEDLRRADEVLAAAGVRVDPPAPEPLDLTPFLSAAVYSYAAWYCDHCHQRRHDPGACPDCRRTLQPVYVAILPREIP